MNLEINFSKFTIESYDRVIAMFVERYGYKYMIRGLGLGGLIAINICGGIVLLIWLIIDPFDLPREDKERLLGLKPKAYTGLAEILIHHIPKKGGSRAWKRKS